MFWLPYCCWQCQPGNSDGGRCTAAPSFAI
nr:MAG TPA: conotoxin [Caudoviricetes sp.]